MTASDPDLIVMIEQLQQQARSSSNKRPHQFATSDTMGLGVFRNWLVESANSRSQEDDTWIVGEVERGGAYVTRG
ncbi:hypothetical protein PC129_g17076 [Phytophthora cactorum]|uniref:Uncharacterized protein n=1 Tax=Phytophthora cactorum TaxID=29920 RepID=A0A8T1BXC5_9STRA|nr:hypothetical protein PC114_g20043 [Phytophthora cactorum]KAG2911605.1 hypothetical protein PC117_g19118 [Phytophthora cactorum]KAG2975595.1 hypothetical protein PC119_g22445 [Phytophthora cactorum]KAG2996768.1 hypothetical protein PC120_g21421 [Phytophthora cactorum]KAG3139217.1 hypothetical protein C6341_g20454 [Phytophthora cactorum]